VYIDARLDEAQRHVRAVDLTVATLKLCIGVLAYLMAVAVADHWLVTGGLGRATRLALWGGLVLVAGWYAVRVLLPLLVHRINPVFAAQTIEQTRPGFKNGLINFLLLRRDWEAVDRDDLSRRVYRGLQVRTANELTHVTVGTTVDRLHVIRLGYLLAFLVAVVCLYSVISPKNPLASFGRVILPWARIGAPTRVEITGVEPGDAAAYQGFPVAVSAEVRGLRSGESVTLLYSSVDGESVDQAVPMSVPEGGFRYQAEFPPGGLGLQQNLLYRIEAGDATSPTFRIDLQIPPAILVQRVEYEYPEYTGLARAAKVRDGDLRALEGTRVTIHSAANYPIHQALIEVEGGSQNAIRMTADGTNATGQLTLAMNPADPSLPLYGWYQLRFTDTEQRENPRPIRHRIEVIPDQRPEVRFLDPPPDELQLPATGSVELKVRAEDPDFGLRRVAIRAEREGRGLMVPPLLNKPRPDKPHQGPFEAAYRFQPATLGLKAGDVVTYWAEAADCKEKEDAKGASGNVAETERRTIHIVAADRRQPPEEQRQQQGAPQKHQAGADQEKPSDRSDGAGQQPGGGDQQQQEKSGKEKGEGGGRRAEGMGEKEEGRGERGEGSGEKQEGSGKKEEGRGEDQAGEPAGQKGESGGKGQERTKPVDGDTNPSEAFERILEQRQEEQARSQPQNEDDGTSKSEPQQGAQKPDDKQASDKQQGAGDQTSENQKKGEGQSKSSDSEQAGSQPEGGSDQKSGKKGGAQPQSDTQQAATRDEPSTSDKGGQNDQPGATDQKGADAKSQAGQKGGAGQGKPEPSSGMSESPPDAEKGKGESEEKGPKGGAGQGKPDASAGISESQPNAEKGKGESEEKGPKGGAGQGKPEPSSGMSESQPDAEKGKGESAEKGEKGGAGQGKPEPSSGMSESQPDADKGKGESAEKGEKADTKGDMQQPSDSQPSGQPSAAEKASQDAEKSAQSMAGADEKGQKKGQEKGDQSKGAKGTESQPRPESGAVGEPAGEKSSSPSRQEANQPRAMNQEDEGSKKQGGDPEAQSPSISPKTSDAKGGAEGDRSGDGKAGGGQKAEQSGSGTPGSKTPSEQGGETSDQQGKGETGNKAGQEAKSDQSTGKAGTKGESQGSGSKTQSGDSDAAKPSQPQEPSQKNSETGKSGKSGAESPGGKEPGQKGGSTSGNPTAGGQAGEQEAGAAAQSPSPNAPEDPNLEYAKKQTTLALEYLADQLAKEKPEVLQRLGWDRAYAENFLRQWEQMRKAAGQPGPQGDAAKQDLEMALKSLGLRPPKSEVRSGQAPRDKLQQLQGADRIPPPLEWMDQFRAYSEGVGGRKRD